MSGGGEVAGDMREDLDREGVLKGFESLGPFRKRRDLQRGEGQDTHLRPDRRQGVARTYDDVHSPLCHANTHRVIRA
jgi:hypothetical protein